MWLPNSYATVWVRLSDTQHGISVETHLTSGAMPMPPARSVLVSWSALAQVYELSDGQQQEPIPLAEEDQALPAWLDAVSVLVFQGQRGSYTARKETKQRGTAYWYAYRKTSGKLLKKYMGKSAALTLARLEEVAGRFPPARTPDAQARPQGPTPPAPGETALPPATAAAQAGDWAVALPPPAPADTPADALTLLRATKLHPPRPRAHLVPRLHLVERLQAGLTGALTLLSAPAGFGKTTLLTQWLSVNNIPVAWLSLEPEDNEPTRFLTSVIAALQTLAPQLGASARALLHSPQPPPLEMVVTTLINDLDAHLTRACVLVLDDYQVLTRTPIHQVMGALVEYGPSHLHLVIATRMDPPLPLTRLRARGQLTELRAAQLQFSAEESTRFLQSVMGLDLPAEALAVLERRTEGWIAGLQLAGLSLQGRPDREQFLADFTTSPRHIAEYLVEEVLAQQPAALQSFLLRTAILDRLTGALCNAVTGERDGEARLEWLDQANLFIVALDEQRQWYRYHQLFAEMLQARLRRTLEKSEVEALYGRASAWYEQHGFPAEAVEMAIKGADFGRAAALIARFYERMLGQYHQAQVLSWLEQLPKELLRTQAPLAVAYASALYMAGQPAVEEPLRVAEQLCRAEGNRHGLGQVFGFRALEARLNEEAAQAIAFGRQALQWSSEADLPLRSLSWCAIGAGERLSGNLRAAWQAVNEAAGVGQRTGDLDEEVIDMARLERGLLLVLQGNLRDAWATFQQVSAGEIFPRYFTEVVIGKGALLLEWNELDAAEQQMRQALSFARQVGDPVLLPRSCVGLARVLQARGERAQARALFAQAVAEAQQRGPPRVHEQAQAAQARWWLAHEETESVARWQASCVWNEQEEPTYQREPMGCTLARVLIAQEEAARALRLLDGFLAHARTQGRLGSELELVVLCALAAQVQGHPEQAAHLLHHALVLGQPAGYLRLFVDEGPALIPVLQRVQATWPGTPEAAYVHQLLVLLEGTPGGRTDAWALPSAPPHSLVPLLEPLSPRERKVLRLLAAGLSNPEIAAELVVSLSTVKTQVGSIYRKLNVHTRKAAITTARSWHLL